MRSVSRPTWRDIVVFLLNSSTRTVAFQRKRAVAVVASRQDSRQWVVGEPGEQHQDRASRTSLGRILLAAQRRTAATVVV